VFIPYIFQRCQLVFGFFEIMLSMLYGTFAAGDHLLRFGDALKDGCQL
jgi:hypothetical protein